MTPIFATDYTGAMEGLIWFGVNALVALALLIVWLLLLFRETRATAIEQLGTLVRCGWVLLMMVAFQIHPNLVVRHPRDWDSFYWMSGISLVLFLAIWVTHRLLRHR